MALTGDQQDQVDELKQLVGETAGIYSGDQELYNVIFVQGSMAAAAARVWLVKSAHYADLIDVSEGSSRRPLSQLRAQADAMATKFSGLAASESGSGAATGAKTKIWKLSR